MGRLAALALAFLGILLLRADAQPQQRVALVIGNGTYQEAGTLANPVNDASDLAEKLRLLGFKVIEGHDLGKRALERKVGEFSDALAGAGVALFFYAGHGLQVDGRNFVVPVDARLDVPAKLRLETVPMDDILDIMESQAATSLVFLDACRNNPFVRSLGRIATNRSARPLQGLAQFASARGSFIAFSTAPDAVAMDGTGRNSPFAAALLSHIGKPGQSINDLMIAVRRDVLAATKDYQRPWEQGSLIERFEFVPADGQPPPAMAQRPAAPPAPEQPAAVAMLERSVGDAASIERFVREDYLVPDTVAVGDSIARLYASPAVIFGKSLEMKDIVRLKADWFAQWASWSLALDPGSLKVVASGSDRADAVFTMSYDYRAKADPTTPVAGRTRVSLGLVMTDGQWRIISETSEVLQ